jgi:uncharacterized protein (DUF58 family)
MGPRTAACVGVSALAVALMTAGFAVMFGVIVAGIILAIPVALFGIVAINRRRFRNSGRPQRGGGTDWIAFGEKRRKERLLQTGIVLFIGGVLLTYQGTGAGPALAVAGLVVYLLDLWLFEPRMWVELARREAVDPGPVAS